MSRPASPAQRRRFEAILRWLDEHGRVEVADAAERLGVSIETARRDLARLEQQGRLRRAHGGAIPVSDPVVLAAAAVSDLPDADADEGDDGGHRAEHAALAAAAVSLLPADGGSVLLDAGPAAEALAAVFPSGRELLVATASVATAAALSKHEGLSVHNLGGRVSPGGTAETGDWTLGELARLHVDVAFLTPAGVSPKHGLTAASAETAAVLGAMAGAADRVVVLASADAAGRAGFVRFAALDEAATVVCPADADAAFRGAVEDSGVRLVVAAAEQ